jgi:hypothetical protein
MTNVVQAVSRSFKSAFKSAAYFDESALTAFSWFIQDLRGETIGLAYEAGFPALLLVEVKDLPRLIGRAEYATKTQWFEYVREGAIDALIRNVNREAQEWLA